MGALGSEKDTQYLWVAATVLPIKAASLEEGADQTTPSIYEATVYSARRVCFEPTLAGLLTILWYLSLPWLVQEA